MTLHQAIKIVFVVEKLICKGVCEIVEANDATGYTIIAAGGKGSRNVRSTNDRASVVDDFANVKIEVILSDPAKAQPIIEKVAAQYFKHYSGIAYTEDIQILRPEKF